MTNNFDALMNAAEGFLKVGRLRDAVSAADAAMKQANIEQRKKVRPICVEIRKAARSKMLSGSLSNDDAAEYYDILKQSYRIPAPECFDDFLIFIEWNRDTKAKFYMPRRFALKPVVDALQELADGALELLGISLPPGTGKSTLAMFFCTWIAGRCPHKGMLIGSHSASILDGMYSETLRLIDPEGEYLWNDVFPGLPVPKQGGTNAATMQINIGKPKRFANWQFASVGSNLAGKVRAQSLLYLDDLVGSLDEALNPALMEKLWRAYTVDYKQRKADGCPELIIATRWSVNDPLGRLIDKHADDPKAKFIAIPALNDKGESNFAYGKECNGYSTDAYLKLKEDMDDMSWRALYMQEPVEREGLLYKEDELRRFYDLPEGEPDAILSVCDTANGKGDSNTMPVGYVYGTDHYIFDCAFTDALPEISDEILVNTLLTNNVQSSQFESNNAGERIADKVYKTVKERGGRTKITKKHTQENKETKILVNSDWVKEHCLFRDPTTIAKGSMYDLFMRELCSYSVKGKNKHDDAADAMAQYALFAQRGLIQSVKIYDRRSIGI